MTRAIVAALSLCLTTCNPIRQVPDLRPVDLLQHCDALLGREVVVSLESHCWRSADGSVVVYTGTPNAEPVIVFEIDGDFAARPESSLVMHGVVARVDRDGRDRGQGRDGTVYRHCVTLTGCRPRLAVGF